MARGEPGRRTGRVLTRARETVARLALGALARTWRIDAAGAEHLHRLRQTGTPFAFALWHAHLLPLVWYHRTGPTSMVVSAHGDGGLLAGAARAWGLGLIRGSSTRGGVGALRQMVRALTSGREIAVTPDGPRGPAGVAKAGVVAAAQLAGAPILPVAAWASSSWRARSWDGFLIPRPFARVRIVYDAPLAVPRGETRRRATQTLQRRLEAVTDLARC